MKKYSEFIFDNELNEKLKVKKAREGELSISITGEDYSLLLTSI